MHAFVPLLAHLIRPVIELDSDPVGVEEEERVVAREFLLRRIVDSGVIAQTALIRVVDLAAGVERERKVLDPDLVVAMFATITIGICDDHRLVRTGIRRVIEAEEGMVSIDTRQVVFIRSATTPQKIGFGG